MKTILFIILICFATLGLSQERKVTFGIQLGYSSSWTSDKSSSNPTLLRQNSSLGSFIIGGLVNFKLNDHVSIQPEVLFSKKGFLRSIDYTTAPSSYKTDEEFNINYIAVPVLVKLNFTKSKMPFFMAGVSPNFALSSKYIYSTKEITPNPSTSSGTINEISNLNSFDLPLTFAFGVERPTGKTFISLQLRYNPSLMDSFDNANSKISSKLSTFNLLAGVRF
jgi:hypothetical protein